MVSGLNRGYTAGAGPDCPGGADGQDDWKQRMGSVSAIPEWTDALSVGVDVLDDDHQAFFRVSALLQEFQSCAVENQDALIETALNILEEYIEGHFLREETALAAADYPDLAAHIALHDDFAAVITRIIQDYRNGDKARLNQLSDLVTNWIGNHILTVDARYRGVLTNENVDNQPLARLIANADPVDEIE